MGDMVFSFTFTCSLEEVLATSGRRISFNGVKESVMARLDILADRYKIRCDQMNILSVIGREIWNEQ